ncbi:uncharacterized protein LOC129572025 [Sitodiplosis mosellana]|uniref:uncharacterized protein LOC129572025 n=1 Tax=Sitodiplosis mosellana TaxID=263140 RepID=UPI002443C2AA|nr:uncharacterized protein LOC129572025 [Sitodiplosis mosellana]
MADKTSELRMNLAAIKRVDPYAKDIIDNSAHVAFYTFNPDETEWEKTDIEGAFFVYVRNAEPYHSVFINNRLNTNSLVEPITAGIELQNQTPFLLYRNERNRIRGFWFYNRSECDRISELVQRIAKDADPLTESQKSGESNLPQQSFDLMTYSNNNVDIFSMLSKAQQDFNNSLSVPKGKGAPQSPDAPKGATNELPIEKKIAPQKGAPVAVPIQIPVNDVGTPQSVMNFFAAAKPTQLKEGPLLQRMLSQPVHIDQIEKRVKTPLKEKQSPPQNQSTSNAKPKQILNNSAHTTYAKAAAAGGIENGLNFMRINSPTQQQSSIDLGTSPLATFIASNNLTHVLKTVPPLSDIKDVESQRQQNEPPQPLQALLKKPVPVAAPKVTGNIGQNAQNNTTPGKPAKLMPPTMFETTANEPNTQRTGPLNANAKAGKNESNETNKKNSMAKGKEAGNQKSRKKSAHDQQPQTQAQAQAQASQNDDLSTTVQPLTETQLLQAISYLMKNDPSFIRKIHEAYLKSFADMVSQ